MPRSRHPNKEIEAAVRYAEENGWTFIKSHGHIWGSLLCSTRQRDGCIFRVYSTPRSPQGHAKDLYRKVNRCPHGQERE